MPRRATLSLTDIVRGAKPRPPAKRQKRAAQPVEQAAQSTAAPVSDVSSLIAGLAGLEQAGALLRAGIAALGQAQAAPAVAQQAMPAVPPGDERISYRLAEAAKALGVSAKVLRREIAAGLIPHRVCGRITIISKAALDAYARGEAGQTESKANG